MISSKNTILVLLFSFYGLSCAYFNTFYNAKRYFEEAEKDILKAEDRTQLPKKTIDILDKTIEKSTTVLTKYPDSRFRDDALVLKGKALFYRDNYTKAFESFDRIIMEETGSPFVLEAKLWLIRCKWKMGDQDIVLSELQELLKEIDNSSKKGSRREYLALGYETTAEIYLERGKVDSAIHYYDESAKYLKGSDQQSQLYFKIAELAFNESWYNTALDFYQKVIRFSRNPKTLDKAHLQVVRITRIESRWKETTTEIQKLLSDNKFADIRPQLYLELAKLYEMQSKIKEAINRYELITQEFQRSEFSAEAYFHLGRLTLETGRSYEEARKYYDSVEKEKRTSMFAPSAQVKVKEIDAILEVIKRIGELKEAVASLPTDSLIVAESPDTTKEINSGSDKDTTGILNELAEELYSYGELLAFHFNQPDSGIHIFERLVVEIPTSPRRAQALFSLAHLYQQSGSPEIAQIYTKQLVSEYPLTEYGEKASALIGLDVHDEAEDVLEEAERVSRLNPKEALTIYQTIVEEYPSSRFVPFALLAMANTYDYTLNDLENSLLFYERLINEFPGSEQAQFVEIRVRQLKELKDSQLDTLKSEVSDVSEEIPERED